MKTHRHSQGLRSEARCHVLRARRLPLILLALAGAGGAAHAQNTPEIRCDGVSDFPCGYQLDAVRLQKVPATMKVQAVVAQSKLPIGEGLFTTVYVKLLRGNEPLCVEAFDDVRVVDSIINLEIGRNMTCELDEVMAENSDLAFQICPGAPDNCMKPIALGASAFAIKSSFATVAEEAHEANVAGQAHYAHRVTADRDLATTHKLRTGYFDFFTPTADLATELYPTPTAFGPWADSGFVTWTPLHERGALDVHVVGKRAGTDQLAELDSLRLMSEDTTATGDVTVTPSPDGKGLTVQARGAHVTGDSDVDGALDVTGALTVQSEGMRVLGDSAVDGALVVSGKTTVQDGGLHATGDSSVHGGLGVSQLLQVLSGGALVTGNSDVDGTLLVHSAVTVDQAGMAVTGDFGLTGRLAVTNRVTVAAGGATVSAGGLQVGAGGLTVGGAADVTGDSRVSGRVYASELELTGSFRARDAGGQSQRAFAMQGMTLVVNPDQTLTETVVAGPVHFLGPVVFDGGVVDPRQPDTFIQSTGESRDLVFGGTLSILDVLTVPGGITGGLAVTGGATVHGALSVPNGITGGLALTGDLTVTGTTTLNGAVTLPHGVAGRLAVAGQLTAGSLAVAGATTFTGAASFPGGVSGEVDFGGNVTVGASGSLGVSGATSLAGLTTSGAIGVTGAARFEQAAVLAGGVSGNTTFASNLNVNGATLLSSAHFANKLTVDGATRFNGTVDFSGAFTGTTQFQNISASGTLTVGGLAIFAGKTSFPGGITGSLTLGNVTIATGLTVGGSATFGGPVSFESDVQGLDDIPAYFKLTGDTRNLTLPSIVVAGDTTIKGRLSLSQGVNDLSVESLRIDSSAASAAFGATTATGDGVVGGTLSTTGKFQAPRCRLCLNYADTNGASADDRKYACAQLQDGASSGQMLLIGDVNNDDVLGLKLLCDGGPSGTGAGEWR